LLCKNIDLNSNPTPRHAQACRFSRIFAEAKIRTRQEPIRTESLLPVQIKLTFNEEVPLYQKLSQKIKELKALGMSHEEIAIKLTTTRKTVSKGLLHKIS
jgi:hypothetical protein